MSETINLNLSAKEKNNQIAEKNRKLFKKSKLKVFNIIGSPGCGKTTLLEYIAEKLKTKLAVIEGDVFTDIDAQRIKKHGSQAHQVETGGGCHLNAKMIENAYKNIDSKNVELLIIENVGNLVCPSTYDLGEDSKIAILSLPEGDEKPAKYPTLFLHAKAVVINKIDLNTVLDYNIERAKADCKKLNNSIIFFEVSAKTGEGMDKLIEYLRK